MNVPMPTGLTRTVVLPRTGAGLAIPIVAGVGRGPTALAAFDAALLSMGVANFNLVRLSSVIPPDSTVFTPDAPIAVAGDWGDRLYCVYARQDAVEYGEEAWAGIAWVQNPETGAGLFVEHEGHSEHRVRADLQVSIDSLCKNRGLHGLETHMHVIGAACEHEPISALVLAPYIAQGWGTGETS